MLTNDERTKTSSGVGQVNAAGSRTHSTAQSRDRRGKQNREIENGNGVFSEAEWVFSPEGMMLAGGENPFCRGIGVRITFSYSKADL